MRVKIHWTQRASKVEGVPTFTVAGTSGRDSTHSAQGGHSILNLTSTRDYTGVTQQHLARRENADFAQELFFWRWRGTSAVQASSPVQ